ncbi:Signal transduction histidine kinase [Chitinophaga sp. CF118]|uniref:hybrid sensor histidine kinase/response regulator transcription factor n=1 Tax=Chitinophaga sp. CF118 TaxID=1884367 RepID=UPI0008DEFEC0|nr:hybrid sensor histidine kinase/response regulator transcription factor [Chitinophaga sp. CF118]SFE01123.1 Signal transduction histidine kinase [Chitinophaga sp. CF118]
MLQKKCLLPLLLVVLSYAHAQQFSALNIHNGLSNNQVNCIYKDVRGFMWFGTMSGLNRYDGNSFKVFRHNQGDSNFLADDYIYGIYPAPGNKLYVKTRQGDNIYDPVKERFSNAVTWLKRKGMPGYGVISIEKISNSWWVAYADSGLYRIDSLEKVTKSKSAKNIASIAAASGNRLVILYTNGSIDMLDTRSDKIIYHTDQLTSYIDKSSLALRLFVDMQDELWIYMPGSDFGVLYLSPAGNIVKQLSSRNGIMNNDLVNSIVQDDNGAIWIGTDHGGINVINKNDFSSRFLMNREGDTKSVAENAIYALYKDNLGIIWSGTYRRGISYYAENMTKFRLYEHKSTDNRSLGYNDVNCFAEDRKGNLWVGTNGAGLIYFDRTANTFTRLIHQPGNDNSISREVIISLYVDAEDNLWIGYYFGDMDYYSKGQFTHYRHNEKDPNSLGNKTVWKIYKDQRNNFWIGTLGGGLDRYDAANGIFYHNNVDLPNSVHSNYISSMAEDGKGDLWIGTAYGIDVLDKSKGIFIHYLSTTHQLSNDNVSSLLSDRNGNMWVGTRDGLNVFDPHTQMFRSFRMEDGLPDNNIISILEDDDGHIWTSTSNGLSKITVLRNKDDIGISCRNYDDKDGLQGKVFNVNAALKLRSGELVFGGADGFNIFDPAEIGQNKNDPSLVFTNLLLFNRPITVNERLNGHEILKASLPETKEIVLRYNENDFSIDFAALNFINAGKNKYAYKLEGFNKEWVIADGETKRITYTNINPGKYTLRLKVANEEGLWNNKDISLQIRILPPFWKTTLAYIIYVLLGIITLYFLRRMVLLRAHSRFALQQERNEAHRLHELDMMKIKLFTNLSHEFRTPVSLILAPLEEIIQHEKDNHNKHKLHLIHRNAKRLLNLVNQLMDFRKMEMHELKLHLTAGDVLGFVKEVACSFTDLAERKQVAFSFNASCDQLNTLFDHDKIQRILFNLLSNAFKFTPGGGFVTVVADVTETADKTWLEIKVIDTGIGIPAERQDKIFEQFFQSDVSAGFVNQGSGIGLAITKEFVKLCNGTITVESEVNKGSSFIVRLPFELLPFNIAESLPEATVSEIEPSSSVKKEQTVLLVEDNEDFRFYLKENLKAFYNIIEAEDGISGWQKTLSAHPDLVVSDINMPGSDGISLCRKIKQDTRTRQIPVILLTAMAGEEQQLRGLETGAADYMIKPFSFEIMLSRVRNILASQAPVKYVIGQPESDNNIVHVPTPDEKFMQKVQDIVVKNLSNASFSVEELSRELCMNRVSVYRRIFALTGKTPIEFIRAMRLQRAAELLTKTGMNITEVAYEVGFNNPKYFARYFKMAYNVLPSSYMAAMRK